MRLRSCQDGFIESNRFEMNVPGQISRMVGFKDKRGKYFLRRGKGLKKSTNLRVNVA